MFNSLGLSDDDILPPKFDDMKQKKQKSSAETKVSQNVPTKQVQTRYESQKVSKNVEEEKDVEKKDESEIKTKTTTNSLFLKFPRCCSCCGSGGFNHQHKYKGEKYFNKKLDPEDETSIPYFLDCIIEEILENHIDEQGLFRKNGSKELIDETVEIMDDQEDEDLEASEIFESLEGNAHSICGLFKHYFRNMKEPALTFDLYYKFVECGNDFESGTTTSEKLRKLITKELPNPNFKLMQKLCHFLNKVGQHSKKNLMTFGNLSLVFGPLVIRPKVLDLSKFNDAGKIARVVNAMISNPEYFFPKR